MPTSIAVITHRITAIITYWNGDGCGRNSPGSIASSSERMALSPSRSSAARSAAVPGSSAGSSGVAMEVSSLMFAASRDEVDDGEDDDPDDVDEVPVQPGDLDLLGVLHADAVLHRHAPQRQQSDDPDRDVGTVEAGEDEEARAEHARLQRETLAVELGELVDLAGDEHGAEQRGGHDPDPEPTVVAALDRRESEHHRERAHQQDERC